MKMGACAARLSGFMLLAGATIAGASLFSGVVHAQIHPDAKTGHTAAPSPLLEPLTLKWSA
jgi:hypothetical protein